MIAATPFSEWLARRFGHRIACLVGAALPGRLARRPLLGRRPRVRRHRGLHGADDRRAAHRDDDLRGRARRRDAEQPHLDRHRAQRHRPGGRHQRRHRRGRHPDRRAGHHPAPRRHLEQRPRRRRSSTASGSPTPCSRSSSASSRRSVRSPSPTPAPPRNPPDAQIDHRQCPARPHPRRPRALPSPGWARLETWRTTRIPGFVLTDHMVEVPLDHDAPDDGRTIEVFAREVVAAGREHDDLPWLLFLQGGPGGKSPRPGDGAVTGGSGTRPGLIECCCSTSAAPAAARR